MEFEDILEDVGSYGPFQKYLVLLFTAPVCILSPFFSMATIFTVSVPKHWCHIPDLVASNLSISQLKSLTEVPEDSRCLMYDLNYSGIVANYSLVKISNDTHAIPCRHGWDYDETNFVATAATKWDMVCEYSYYPSLILTLQNMGSLIGTPTYGLMADRVGRKLTFFIAVFITAIAELMSVLTSNFIFFAVLKTISGAAMFTVVFLPYVLASEVISPKKRVQCSGVVNCGWMVGMCILPLVAYLLRNWVTLGLFNASAGILIMLYWKYIPESPIWLVSVERYEEALEIMMRIGKKNKKDTDEAILYKKLKNLGQKIKQKNEENESNFCVSYMMYPRLRKIFFILTLCYIANITAYIGFQYSVTYLEGSEFLNFFLLSVVEAPGNILFWILMERLGRRWSASIGFVITGLVSLLPLTEVPYCEIISAVIGKLLISGVFMVTDQQSCELYPTVSRSFGVGMSKSICKATTLLVPYLIYLGKYGKSIPFIIISLLCVQSGVLAAFLPETLNENLPQSIEDSEEFGKNQKFFSFNRKKQKVNSCSISVIDGTAFKKEQDSICERS